LAWGREPPDQREPSAAPGIRKIGPSTGEVEARIGRDPDIYADRQPPTGFAPPAESSDHRPVEEDYGTDHAIANQIVGRLAALTHWMQGRGDPHRDPCHQIEELDAVLLVARRDAAEPSLLEDIALEVELSEIGELDAGDCDAAAPDPVLHVPVEPGSRRVRTSLRHRAVPVMRRSRRRRWST